MNIINNAKLCLYINGFTIKYTCWYVEILLEKNRDIAAQEKRGEEMDSYKKERSSKQHLKIDKERESLLLANPMACEVSPNSTLAESPSASLTTSVSIGQISRSSERSSFKGKSRSKSPSLFKFFQRGGGNRKVSAEEPEEDDYASSSSDHEDPFSVSTSGGGGFDVFYLLGGHVWCVCECVCVVCVCMLYPTELVGSSMQSQ